MGQREGARGKSFFQKLLPLWKNLGTREAGDEGKLSLSRPLWCWLRALVRILQVSVKGIFSQIAVSLALQICTQMESWILFRLHLFCG